MTSAVALSLTAVLLAGCFEMRSGTRVVEGRMGVFKATVATSHNVVFAAPEHDYPYRRVPCRM